MKVVAFLQNMWFRDPARVRQIIESVRPGECPHERREYHIAAFLFMGCLTGRRLRAAFGDDWTEQIVWEEVSREYGGHSSSVFPADHAHIRLVLARHKPDCVLAFGKIAGNALAAIQKTDASMRMPPLHPPFTLITGPHPAARHAIVVDELKAMRRELDARMKISLTESTATA